MSTEPVGDDDTRPTPGLPPLVLENGFRRVMTGSEEERELVAAGYSIAEHDDRFTLLRPARRASDRHVTDFDLLRWRDMERLTLDRIVAELREAGVGIDTDQLRWAMDQFRARVMREVGRFQTNGRIR